MLPAAPRFLRSIRCGLRLFSLWYPVNEHFSYFHTLPVSFPPHQEFPIIYTTQYFSFDSLLIASLFFPIIIECFHLTTKSVPLLIILFNIAVGFIKHFFVSLTVSGAFVLPPSIQSSAIYLAELLCCAPVYNPS